MLQLLASLALISAPLLCGAEDMAGSRDFPDLPRVKGTSIVGYDFQEYAAGRFATAIGDNARAKLTRPEGKRTRIIYLGQPQQSALQIFRNYQQAFAGFGPFVERFSCRGRLECRAYLAPQTVWSQDNRVDTTFRFPNSLYTPSSYRDPMYLYGTVQKDDTLYHLSVFTAHLIKGQPGVKDMPIAHVEVIEVDEFEAELVFVDANEITSTLAALGSIALYGIQFEFDQAELVAASQQTLAEIAKAMTSQPNLEVFVVGHTDNVGAYDYNVQLAGRRVQAVVDSLVQDHGVAPDRLMPVGVGPVAPKVSNDTEEGRATNRRVEIVTR